MIMALLAINTLAPERMVRGDADREAALHGVMGTMKALAQSQTQVNPRHVQASKLLLKHKLSKVPVFLVTNEGGSPFLSTLSGGDQASLMFTFPADAQRMLNGVLKAPNGASSGAKILPTTLDRAFKLAQLEPTLSGLRDQVTNRELSMVWQFMPHAPEVRAAQSLLVQKMKAPIVPKVPAYMAEGLAYVKRGTVVRPVFLCRKDLEASLAKLEQKSDGAKAEVVVLDLLQLLLQLNEDIEADTKGIKEELQSLEIVPPSEAMSFKDQVKKGGPPLKPKVVLPDKSNWNR